MAGWIGEPDQVEEDDIKRRILRGVIHEDASPERLLSRLFALPNRTPPNAAQLRALTITQTEVATLAGITKGAVSRWSKRKGYPKPVAGSGRGKDYRLLEVLTHLRARGESESALSARTAALPPCTLDRIRAAMAPNPAADSAPHPLLRGRGEFLGEDQGFSARRPAPPR